MLDVVALIFGELKLALLSTCRLYEVAPLAELQVKVGVVSQVLLPLAGEDRLVPEGGARMVKLQVEDQRRSPQELMALTRQ